ncbi:MAG: hypothetical protein PF694_02325 [Bacteroidetes bacterium]|jgi:hypothetical protein|nr:hypothetical protein [Bacteroidota bacterium]
MYLKIAQQILQELSDEPVETDALSLSKLIEEISKINSDLAFKLNQFISDKEAYEFVKKDFELKSKLKDIWELQCKMLHDKSEQSLLALIASCEALQLSIEGMKID